jgi:cytochrome c
MRKVVVLFLAASLSAWTLTSCGSKKEEAKEDSNEYGEYETAEPKDAETKADAKGGDAQEDLIKQGEALTAASDCKTCHALDNKIVGPGHKEVAAKYEFTRANVTMLAGKIISGGAGNWGDIPMTAHPDVSQGDAEKMAMYVLSLDGEKLKD